VARGARSLDRRGALRKSAQRRPARRARPRARRARTRRARAFVDHHGIDLDVHGERPATPAILVANHISYLDPLVVVAEVAALSVSKAEVGEWPLVGARLHELGVLFVRRASPWSGACAIRQAIRVLRAGASILNFPEGTTTVGHTLCPFKRGIFGAARLAGVPIVPVRVDYDDPAIAWVGGATFAPHYARLARMRRVVARLRFDPPIAPDRPIPELVERARARLAVRC
jgi:1-acyl-sn-glycerol-3-phosphate acyltransferase